MKEKSKVEDTCCDEAKTEKSCENAKVNSEETKKENVEAKSQDKKTETASKDNEDSLKKAQDMAEEYKSLYLRKAADFENYRKRMIREKAEMSDYATSKLILEILPILDNFDRAIKAEVEEKAESIKAFVDGVTMIKGQLEGMLSRDYGLSYYEAKGKVFDPNIHEAIAKQPSTDVKVETVGEEIQKGYKLKDKVLRHAKVLVLMPTESDEKEN